MLYDLEADTGVKAPAPKPHSRRIVNSIHRVAMMLSSEMKTRPVDVHAHVSICRKEVGLGGYATTDIQHTARSNPRRS